MAMLFACHAEARELKVSDFNKEVKVTGTKIMNCYKSTVDCIVKGDYFIHAHGTDHSYHVSVYSLSQKKSMGSFKIPNLEPFESAVIFKSASDEYLCGIYFSFSKAVYGLNPKMQLVRLKSHETVMSAIEKGIFNTGMMTDEAIYHSLAIPAQNLSSVFRYDLEKNGKTQLLYDVKKDYADDYLRCAGGAAMDESCERFVYYHRFNKRFDIVDSGRNKSVSHISFSDVEGFRTKIDPTRDLLDSQPIFYTNGVYSDNSIYLVSSEGWLPGEKPKDIVVERFSEDGTPVARFILDKWGRVAIDAENEKAYMLCYDDGVLYSYDLSL